uniref:'chromo' domain containing protein n=1 Tax=Syphacia muris TaxID=451379 RepID=A0A0N5AG12_9BILA
MAREKNSTFTAESAIPEEEQSTTPATKVVTPPGKKKAVGKRNGDVGGNGVSNNNGGGLGGGNGNGCGRASNNAGKNGVTSGRGNKTLGWFLDDILFENANKNSSAESDVIINYLIPTGSSYGKTKRDGGSDIYVYERLEQVAVVEV